MLQIINIMASQIEDLSKDLQEIDENGNKIYPYETLSLDRFKNEPLDSLEDDSLIFSHEPNYSII